MYIIFSLWHKLRPENAKPVRYLVKQHKILFYESTIGLVLLLLYISLIINSFFFLSSVTGNSHNSHNSMDMIYFPL